MGILHRRSYVSVPDLPTSHSSLQRQDYNRPKVRPTPNKLPHQPFFLVVLKITNNTAIRRQLHNLPEWFRIQLIILNRERV
ncbi:MAG TPA: hypothetical protein VN345_02015, partial [Blastocatellia bacterium]|nr:hypothetical protein [Blastocatellia bacterium]